jgi:hypothetical protein
MPPGIGGPPGLPKDVFKDKMPAIPGTEKLTEAQKKTLKEIHEKYSKPGKSSLAFVVHPDRDPQTLNIPLK